MQAWVGAVHPDVRRLDASRMSPEYSQRSVSLSVAGLFLRILMELVCCAARKAQTLFSLRETGFVDRLCAPQI